MRVVELYHNFYYWCHAHTSRWFPPRRIGDCKCHGTVSCVFFEFTDPFTGNIEVGQAMSTTNWLCRRRLLMVVVYQRMIQRFVSTRYLRLYSGRFGLLTTSFSDSAPFASSHGGKRILCLTIRAFIVCVPTCVEETDSASSIARECAHRKEAQCLLCEECILNQAIVPQCPPPQKTHLTTSSTTPQQVALGTTSTSTTTNHPLPQAYNPYPFVIVSATGAVPVPYLMMHFGGARGEDASLGFDRLSGCNLPMLSITSH